MKKKRIILFIAMILGCIAFPIFFWKSLSVWLTPLFPIALTLYVCAIKKYRRWVYVEELKGNIFLYITLVAALVSTTLQFWQQIIITLSQFIKYMNEPAFIWVMGILAILVVIALVVLIIREYREKKADKKRALVCKAQNAADEIKRQTKNEERKKMKEEGQQMLRALMIKSSELSWKDLLKIMDKGVQIPDEMVLRANFFDLIEVSNVKNQIFYNPHLIRQMVSALGQAADDCHNDSHLQRVRVQLEKLRTLSPYLGYNSLMAIFRKNEYLLNTFGNIHWLEKESVNVQ
jgi:uncharacterized membrane protein